jgi:hypothetical protein
MSLFSRGKAPRATRQVAEVPQVSIGRFAGVPLPQDPRRVLLEQLLPTQLGVGPSIAAVRLGSSTDRAHRYFGTDGLPPLRMPLAGPPHANQPEDLEQAIFKPNA